MVIERTVVAREWCRVWRNEEGREEGITNLWNDEYVLECGDGFKDVHTVRNISHYLLYIYADYYMSTIHQQRCAIKSILI